MHAWIDGEFGEITVVLGL